MPSLPNPETTMTLAGVGMVRDSSFSSSFFFFPLSFSSYAFFDQSLTNKKSDPRSAMIIFKTIRFS
jgi:hypothetical protein